MAKGERMQVAYRDHVHFYVSFVFYVVTPSPLRIDALASVCNMTGIPSGCIQSAPSTPVRADGGAADFYANQLN